MPENVPDTPQNVSTSPEYKELLSCLSGRQARFVEEYLIDLNETKAAMRAGYAESGAHKQGYRLTRNATVKAAIDAGKEEISRRAMINQDEVIKELARIGFADMAKYVKIDHSGAIQAIALEELEEGASRVIKKVKEKRNIRYSDSGDQIMESTYEFELHDKVKALLGILDRVKPTDPPPTQKIEHSVTFTSMPPQPKTMKEWEDLCHPERKKNPM